MALLTRLYATSPPPGGINNATCPPTCLYAGKPSSEPLVKRYRLTQRRLPVNAQCAQDSASYLETSRSRPPRLNLKRHGLAHHDWTNPSCTTVRKSYCHTCCKAASLSTVCVLYLQQSIQPMSAFVTAGLSAASQLSSALALCRERGRNFGWG